MYSKGIAVIAITRNGVETALKINNALTSCNLLSKVYAPSKYAQEGVISFESKLESFMKDTYHVVSAVVGVMATGVLIRAIAPNLENKLVDPAVVCIDASGKFVISLLSGHYGGANELTNIIAQRIGATPVITTASEVTGKPSVEDVARILQLTIANPESTSLVNAAITNGDRVVLVKIGEINLAVGQLASLEFKQVETPQQALQMVSEYDAGIIITKEALPVTTFVKPITIFKMQRVTIGLGILKEVTTDEILRTITSTLKENKIPFDRITGIATVDINQDSQNMRNASVTLGFELKFLSPKELEDFIHEDLSPLSNTKQETIEIENLCERAALFGAGKNSHLLLKNITRNGVIIALASGE